MRFMVMHKMTQEMERGLPLEPATIAGVHALVDEGVKKGIFVSGEGLKPSSERYRVVYENGKRTVTDGPFTEAKELVAGFALLRVQSKEEAIGWMDKVAALSGDAELVMGPVVEPWDLGLTPQPANPPLRILALRQANESAKDAPPDAKRMQRLGGLVAEMTAAGVLQATGGLTSTKDGARIHYAAGKHSVVDGPFAESKELVAGYAILDVPSKAAAVEWSLRFGDVVKVNEIEVRALS
ncbi:MAG TPA: YciI family protein [Polyangiaceae bacterium]|nr:YciI family protein [Polyangiaceae bacterium]